jgi:uncharacterized protein with PIN domain
VVTVKFCPVSITVWLTVLRFIADGMLGKLARWLRMLGHDVQYYRDSEDKKLLEMAQSEKRVLLTSDLELYHRAKTHGAKAVFVEAGDGAAKLADLANLFGFRLEIDLSISRCPKCNEMIRAVSKEMVINQIPELTSRYYDEFWKCLGCGQVYWRGAHWKKIEKTLEEAKRKLDPQ